jgi:hypothetical protein
VRETIEAHAVGEAREVVEDTDDVGDLEQRRVIEAESAQRLPVLQPGVTLLDTQKLCVRLRSVVGALSGGGHRGDRLALAAVEGVSPNMIS